MTMNGFWSGIAWLVRIDIAICIAGTATLLIWLNWH